MRPVTFGQSIAEVIDHAKSFLLSLVDKREELEVQNIVKCGATKKALPCVGDSTFFDIHRTLLGNCGETSIPMPAGLICLGTPPRGSEKATYGKVLANVAQFISDRPPQRLLNALQMNSDVLLRLTSDFRFQLPDFDVYSFFELRPMKGLSSLVFVPTSQRTFND